MGKKKERRYIRRLYLIKKLICSNFRNIAIFMVLLFVVFNPPSLSLSAQDAFTNRNLIGFFKITLFVEHPVLLCTSSTSFHNINIGLGWMSTLKMVFNRMKSFISYWYLQYLLATSVYMLEPLERRIFSILFLCSVLLHCNNNTVQIWLKSLKMWRSVELMNQVAMTQLIESLTWGLGSSVLNPGQVRCIAPSCYF